MKFTELNLAPWLEENLAAIGFEEATPIQAAVIPHLMEVGGNLIGQAQTGTGKTAAFGLPMLNTLTPGVGHVQGVVLCPTRELAIQVSSEILKFAGKSKFNVVTIYGGASPMEQRRALSRGAGADIVVATPGRCIDFIKRGNLDISKVKYAILDEADEMLDMGFLEDVEYILGHSPEDKISLMFSATMPPPLRKIAERYLKNSHLISIAATTLTTLLTDQIIYEVGGRDKREALGRLMDMEDDFYGLIFCRTRVEVEQVADALTRRGLSADYLHGDVSQDNRERLLKRFRERAISLLVATDVAARGIDIKGLTHVVNYSLPEKPDTYVHRIGRTGRAGQSGKAISLVTPADRRLFQRIKQLTRAEFKFEKLPHGESMVELASTRILRSLETVSEGKAHESCDALAERICSQADAQNVVARLLELHYSKQLELKSYPEIGSKARSDRGDRPERGERGERGAGRDRGDRGAGRDRRENLDGTVKLFIAKGRRDNMSPKGMIDLITTTSKVPPRFIDNLRMASSFSTFHVSEQDSATILSAFKQSSKGSRSLVKVDEKS